METGTDSALCSLRTDRSEGVNACKVVEMPELFWVYF